MYSIKLGCEKVFWGKNAVQQLKTLEGPRKRAFIVMSGNVLIDVGSYKKVTDVLEEAGFEYEAYTEVEPEPSFQTILKGAERMKTFKPDWIIGFGGGSAMDAAKAMWVFYENPAYRTLEETMPPNIIENLRVKAKVCCIATSAGTGSEATRAALIKDMKQKKKYSVRDMNGRLVPDAAVLDPEFTATMPKSLTAASGMDALTHAIESYVTPTANPFSKAMSLAAFLYGYKSLEKVYENPEDENAGAEMLAASCMGGIAFSNSGLGIVHGIAHSFGAEYGVPHGLANAIVLPYGLEYNSRNDEVKKMYDELAGFIGKKSLADAVAELSEKINIPKSMKEKVQEDTFIKNLDKLTEKAMSDVATPFNPIQPTAEEMKELILKVYYGKDTVNSL